MAPPGEGTKYKIFRTKAGWMVAIASEKGLVALTLPQPTKELALKRLELEPARVVASDNCFKELLKQLHCYFSGQVVNFSHNLDITRATDFQTKVWQASRLIPYGETRSYRWLAEKIGHPKAARAVGQALARNPLPVIIPCHRVIKEDGSIGGFSGGLKTKRLLLSLEKAL